MGCARLATSRCGSAGPRSGLCSGLLKGLIKGSLAGLVSATAALPLAAQPAVIFALGGKADRSFNQAADAAKAEIVAGRLKVIDGTLGNVCQ